MLSQKYSEDQMTPWFRLAQSPAIPGGYELRKINAKEILEGGHSEKGWLIRFSGNYSPLRLQASEFEWRGLNFDATPRTSTWEFVVS